MVTLRLFAHLREIAGTGRLEVEADDVAGAIDAACRRFGPAFTDALGTAAVWLDGEPVDDPSSVVLRPSSELALVPPVSGGA